MCKKYPILYCFLVATVIICIMGFLFVAEIYPLKIIRAKKKYRKLSKKYNSKCIIAISVGFIKGVRLDYGYAIATEEKLIFTNEDFGMPIEISIPYEKIVHFEYTACYDFLEQYKNKARKEINYTLYLKNATISFTSSTNNYSRAFNTITFQKVNFYEYLSKFIPTRDMRIEI